MIEIAVCDDMESLREELINCLLLYSMKKDFEYTVDEYESGDALVYSDKKYDLIFMDYQFDNGMNGIMTSKVLRSQGNDATIIFLSSYPDKVFESFEVNAFRFLVKPIDREKFDEAMDSFLESEKDNHIINVSVDGVTQFINENRIIYIMAEEKCSLIHISGEADLECREMLSALGHKLTEKDFYRCSRSYMVNLRYVIGNDHKYVFLNDGSRVPLRRGGYKEFVSVFSKYAMEKKL